MCSYENTWNGSKNTSPHKHCTWKFIADLFIIAKNWTRFRCSINWKCLQDGILTQQWTGPAWYRHGNIDTSQEYYVKRQSQTLKAGGHRVISYIEDHPPIKSLQILNLWVWTIAPGGICTGLGSSKPLVTSVSDNQYRTLLNVCFCLKKDTFIYTYIYIYIYI